jgi:hypothetical protein
LDCGDKGWHFEQFIDDIDVFHDCSFILKLVDCLPQEADHLLFQSCQRKAKQLVDEYARLEDLDVAEVVFDVVD